MITQRLICDVGKEKSDDIFYVQGEHGREIVFDVINSLLDETVTLTGYTATIHILKSDGNFTIENMSIIENKLKYVLTDNDCAVGGNGIYDISLSKNNELIYTSHGFYIGDSRAVSDDVVSSVSVAYGVTFPEGFQQKLIAGENITINNNVISARSKEYTAGDGITISSDDVISIAQEVYNILTSHGESITALATGKQDKLTAGDNITILNNVISSKKPTITLIKNVGNPPNTIDLSNDPKISDYDFLITTAIGYYDNDGFRCWNLLYVPDIVPTERTCILFNDIANMYYYFNLETNVLTYANEGSLSYWHKLKIYGVKL